MSMVQWFGISVVRWYLTNRLDKTEENDVSIITFQKCQSLTTNIICQLLTIIQENEIADSKNNTGHKGSSHP